MAFEPKLAIFATHVHGEHGQQHQLATLVPYEIFSAIHACGAPLVTAVLGDVGPECARDYWTAIVVRLSQGFVLPLHTRHST